MGNRSIGTVRDESSVKATIPTPYAAHMGHRPRAGIIQRPAVRLAHGGKFAWPVLGRFIGGKGRLMGRGPKPAKSKVEGKAPVTRKSPKDDDSKVRDLEARLAEALEQLQTSNRERAEAREQRTATA